MVNLGNPDLAFQTGLLPNDGVGLARMEFIVAEHIRVHPMALVHPERVADAAVRAQIAQLTKGHAHAGRVLRARSSPRAWAPSPQPSTRGR